MYLTRVRIPRESIPSVHESQNELLIACWVPRLWARSGDVALDQQPGLHLLGSAFLFECGL